MSGPYAAYSARQAWSRVPRPVYREPHPVAGVEVAAGVLAGAIWMTLFALLATTARGYAWCSITAGVVAWASAAALAQWGRRGVAAGIAIAVGVALTVTNAVVLLQWLGGHWVLW